MKSRLRKRHSPIPSILCCLLWLCNCSAYADLAQAAGEDDSRYLAELQVHTADELNSILQRAADLHGAGQLDAAQPVVFVLHGAEGKVFLRERYSENRGLVDLAARLTALDVVDIRVCERWMGWQRIDAEQLQPFVTTVPSGPDEINRLRGKEAYVSF